MLPIILMIMNGNYILQPNRESVRFSSLIFVLTNSYPKINRLCDVILNLMVFIDKEIKISQVLIKCTKLMLFKYVINEMSKVTELNLEYSIWLIEIMLIYFNIPNLMNLRSKVAKIPTSSCKSFIYLTHHKNCIP